jgi:hypothetical protein
MGSLVVHPDNQDQLTALIAMCKAMNISFEHGEAEQYEPEFIEKVMRGKRDIEEGRSIQIKDAKQLDEIFGV